MALREVKCKYCGAMVRSGCKCPKCSRIAPNLPDVIRDKEIIVETETEIFVKKEKDIIVETEDDIFIIKDTNFDEGLDIEDE